jgi:hypothetical protein
LLREAKEAAISDIPTANREAPARLRNANANFLLLPDCGGSWLDTGLERPKPFAEDITHPVDRPEAAIEGHDL